MENTINTTEPSISELERKQQEFQTIKEERDGLLAEVSQLKKQIDELVSEKDKLQAEHAEELAVLSSSFSEHFTSNGSGNTETHIKECEREIQKLRNTIEDKNYHINKLQKNLLRTQMEMESEQEKHESELEELRAQLDKLENSDTESLVEERMKELKANYEREVEELKERLAKGESDARDSELTERIQEIDDLKSKMADLEESMEHRLEQEETKFRREVLAVKDRLIHQHRTEIDDLLSQLERSNAEVDKLRKLSMQQQSSRSNSIEAGEFVANGDIGYNEAAGMNGSLSESSEDRDHPELMRVTIKDGSMAEELERIHAQYQKQVDHLTNKLKEQFQNELDDNVHRIEEDWEQQFERQRNDYEDKILAMQRQIRAQHQSDLEQVTVDMEEQIQSLKNDHAEEITDLMQRMRGLSEERRQSYIEVDTTQQQVFVIKEEFQSKVESLEQELSAERAKVADYEAKLGDVEMQVQAFKAEKEKEVKFIEDELKKQCKALVEKKAKELKEKYQGELNEKVNKVERTLRKQYEEDIVKGRSELEETNRTLKEKYESEVSEIMLQMEQVQQRNQEVFEAQQKEQFEKQLSLVKDELQPYKSKCQELEQENKELMEKYERDLSELKNKMDEVEERYKMTENIEEEGMKTLEHELQIYKAKVKELEDGNRMLVENYGAQLENMKRKYDEMEEGEVRTLQEEVNIYMKKAEKLGEEKSALMQAYEDEVKLSKEKLETLESSNKKKDENFDKLAAERQELSVIVDDLSKQLESYISNCAELEEAKRAMDNRLTEKVESLTEKIKELENDLEESRRRCLELEGGQVDSETAIKIAQLEQDLSDSQSTNVELEEEKKNIEVKHFEEIEKFSEKLQCLEKELQETQEKYLNEKKEKLSLVDKRTSEVQGLTDRVADLEKDLEDATANCYELTEVKRAMENKHFEQMEELHSNLNNALENAAKKDKDFEAIRKDKNQLESKLEQVSEELQLSKRRVMEIEIEKEQLKSSHGEEISDLTKKIGSVQENEEGVVNEEIKQLLHENRDLKHELQAFKATLESVKESNSNILQEKKKQSDEFNFQVAELKEKVQALEDENRKGASSLDDIKVKYELLIANLKDDIETQKQNNGELELANNRHMQEIVSLVQEVERLKSETGNTSTESVTEDTQTYKDHIEELQKENDRYKSLIEELEYEGHDKFGVLLSQHEKELESLKEELEEQIAKKREQLAKEAGAKRQKLKEEYEGKLRVIYEELVSERSKNKELMNQNNQLSQKVKLLEGVTTKQKKDIERVKQMEEKLKELERQSKQSEETDNPKVIESYEDKIKALEKEISNLKDRNNNGEKVQELLHKVTYLEGELKERSVETEKLKQTLQEREEQIERLKEEFQEKSRELDKMRKEVEGGGALVETLQELLRERCEEVDVLKEKISDKRQVQDKNPASNDKAEEEASTKEERVNDLERKLDELQQSNTRLLKELEESQASTAKLQRNIHNMDKAKQAVIEMYDGKIDQLAQELDDAIHKGDDLSQKLVSLSNTMDERVAERDTLIRETSQELEAEKCKSAGLEKELQSVREAQNSDNMSSVERMKEELFKEHEELNSTLRMNYEDIFAKKEQEYMAKTKELEIEVVALKGMVANLEQLGQLKDDENASNIRENEEKHCFTLQSFKKEVEVERNMMQNKVLALEKLTEVQKESIEELQQRLDSVNETKVKGFSEQIVILQTENERLKRHYENELNLLKNQIAFENNFEVELEEGHQREMNNRTEAIKLEHMKEVKKLTTQLQIKCNEVEAIKCELHKKSTCLEEHEDRHREATESLKEKYEIERKTLQNAIQEQEQQIVKYRDQVETLSSQLEVIAAVKRDSTVSKESSDVSDLQKENRILTEKLSSLQEDIKTSAQTHESEIASLKAELESEYQQRQDRMTKDHADELDKLMVRLESLVQQENASKALTESHMLDLEVLRSKMGKNVERLAWEKIESTKRLLEEEFDENKRAIEDQLRYKRQEVDELKKYIKSLKSKMRGMEEEIARNHDEEGYMKGELKRLRDENAELLKSVREQRQRKVHDADSKRIERLRDENERLKVENESLKRTERFISSRTAERNEGSDASDKGRLSQLMKFMEHLMSERNQLELKLREELLDLKTKYGDSRLSSVNECLQPNASPDKPLTKDAISGMLQALRETKAKQEKEIQSHIREIEDMIKDIKEKIRSAEFADRRIQEVLTSQLRHLEEQRRLLVDRLQKLREKHKVIEDKLLRQMAHITSSTSPGDEARSKYYENLLEENLQREKRILSLKRKQISDLQQKLSQEKVEMERKVAESQQLQIKLKEKDRLEKELSTERQALEKKWVDTLKKKERVLENELKYNESRKLNDSGSSTASRISGLISRSFEIDKASPRYHSSPESVNDCQPLDHLKSLSRKTREYPSGSDRVSQTYTNEYYSPRNRMSNREDPLLRDFCRLPNEQHKVHTYVPHLEIELDEEDLGLELDLPTNIDDTFYWEVDSKDDSDIEFYSPESETAFEVAEKNWGRNLEEELNRISAGKVRVDKKTTQELESRLNLDYRSNKQSDSSNYDPSFSTYSWLQKTDHSVSRHGRESTSPVNLPRASTAIPGKGNAGNLSHNQSMDISRIPTILPNLLKEVNFKSSATRDDSARELRAVERPTIEQRRSLSSLYAEQQRSRLDPKTNTNFEEHNGVVNSPRSVKSEPTEKGGVQVSESSSGLRKMSSFTDMSDSTAVFLLNIDDYIDRHQVRSSHEVANLRDLSPTESRYHRK
ncbi:trichohyalin [Nematostella vectensis]|uniref:trichohyalin n=1 Tax=Nematostella vectensis TaxID=45351 RepID=UPI0020775991|nr:trichohyalin [Nematostella vectensis]XP_048582946.1 trichohyalin [Nematostella vectensis]XP_048582947.1 trichohyalin [Nematostella vectensis]XP_048582948.1 trichohyalin [Nematostella vectensis]XP_048582950.1 trichohyalin [Nematostella vectensis]XP_048582951.1 trichohyalin [Nematostella vectensis]